MLIYPPTQNGLQKTLDAQLDQGTTSSMTLNNVTGIQNKAGVVVINRIDSSGNLKEASVREWISYTGVSGSTLTGLTRGLGGSTDQDHAVGSVVEFVFDITAAQSIAEALATLVDETNHTTVNTTNIVTPTGTQNLKNKTITDTNDNEVVKFGTTASAVNEVTITNAATGSGPTIAATGGDTNIDLLAIGKGSGVTKISTMRQDDTTNSSKHNSIILSGWGFITGDGSNSRKSEAVTFGKTFAAAPIVYISFAGYKNSSDPTAIGEFNATTDNQIAFRTYSVTTTGFTAEFKGSGAPAASERVGYTWIAIGEL